MNAHASVTIAAAVSAPSGTSVLAEKAVLARPTISQWTARRFDRKASDAVTTANKAASNAGRFNKLLLAPDALGEVQRIDCAARDYHYSRTLPWTDEGARILPAAMYLDYARRMAGYRAEFEAAVTAFVAGYPDFVDASRARLGDLFNAADYPAATDVRSRFRFDLAIFPIPSGDDFRLTVPDAVRADVERRTAEALSAAIGDAGRRVSEAVGRMAERLRDYRPATGAAKAEGIFRDSLVENVRDLVDVLPAFNLTGDPRFAAIVDRMRAELCRHGADTLREDSAVRAEVAAAAASILEDVSDFLA